MTARMMLRILFLSICFSCTISVFAYAEESSSSSSSSTSISTSYNECYDSHCGKEVGEAEEVKCISDVFNGLDCSKGKGGEIEGVLWDPFSFQWDDMTKFSSILFHLLQTQEDKSLNRKEQEEEKIRMLEFLDDERMSSNYHEKELQLLRHLMQLSKAAISSSSKEVKTTSLRYFFLLVPRSLQHPRFSPSSSCSCSCPSCSFPASIFSFCSLGDLPSSSSPLPPLTFFFTFTK
jgi:hypothetical protein